MESSMNEMIQQTIEPGSIYAQLCLLNELYEKGYLSYSVFSLYKLKLMARGKGESGNV